MLVKKIVLAVILKYAAFSLPPTTSATFLAQKHANTWKAEGLKQKAQLDVMAVQQQSAYEYPPIYNFAPFFTLQRNPATYTSQVKLWTRFLLDFCQYHQIFALNLEAAWEKNGAGGLFKNEIIKRELSIDARREVLKALVDEGNGAWDPPIKGKTKASESGSKVLVFWKKPEEWGEKIYNWVVNTGQNRSIMTFFELTEGDLVQSTDFGSLPLPILRLALASLEKQGKAKVFEGSESGDDMAGVKFA